MQAWQIAQPGPVADGPLQLVERDEPEPGPGEVRVRVRACGVCRTDLHIAEGDLALHARPVVPGHEVVGIVDAVGPDTVRFAPGDRVGIAWLRATCGRCRFCRSGRENLCLRPQFTGWDADGGYARYAVVPEAFAHRLPDAFTDIDAAPLLCAGIIGYRALRVADVPAGGRLGLWGFGASAHLAAQVAVAAGVAVHVFTRSQEAQRDALDLGAQTAGPPDDAPPTPLDGAILFAPVGHLVPTALEALDRGGVLAIAGIHLSDVPPLSYDAHLFQERQVRSVTANTRADAAAFLRIAARIGIRVVTTPYAFADAATALRDLAEGRVRGAAVLDVG